MFRPIFIISLDFELHWGRFDSVNLKAREKQYLQTRYVIPKILSLFKKHEIEATWATVGMLFARNIHEWKNFGPLKKPTYYREKCNAYTWLDNNPNVPFTCLFAPELVELIFNTHGQELASHTFSHYYTKEAGQTAEQFQQDLQSAQRIAMASFGGQMTSLVFPRNQFNSAYLKICKEEGFSVIRSSPENGYWRNAKSELIANRAIRTGDAYLKLGKKTSYLLEDIRVSEKSPVMIPASRFLRPYHPWFPHFNRWRIRRIKEEISLAAKSGEVYHLWWHPHNFGRYPKESLGELEEILRHFGLQRGTYGMASMNMRNVKDLLIGQLRQVPTDQ